MFNPSGITEAKALALAQSNEMSLKDLAAKNRQAERSRLQKEWSEEMVKAWQQFLLSDEYKNLSEAIIAMNLVRLPVPNRSLDFRIQDDKPFVKVYNTGGYYSPRNETPHSPEGYFSTIVDVTISPQEGFNRLLVDLDDAFEHAKHHYRYTNDKSYRETIQLQEKNSSKKPVVKESCGSWLLPL